MIGVFARLLITVCVAGAFCAGVVVQTARSLRAWLPPRARARNYVARWRP